MSRRGAHIINKRVNMDLHNPSAMFATDCDNPDNSERELDSLKAIDDDLEKDLAILDESR